MEALDLSDKAKLLPKSTVPDVNADNISGMAIGSSPCGSCKKNIHLAQRRRGDSGYLSFMQVVVIHVDNTDYRGYFYNRCGYAHLPNGSSAPEALDSGISNNTERWHRLVNFAVVTKLETHTKAEWRRPLHRPMIFLCLLLFGEPSGHPAEHIACQSTFSIETRLSPRAIWSSGFPQGSGIPVNHQNAGMGLLL